MKARGNQGVSLPELLAAMGLVGVLATVAVPCYAAFLRNADDAKCLSNLRQIGTAILIYTSDHDGFLPGPLNSAQYPWWPHYSQLCTYVADYLPIDKSHFKRREDVFLCPAYKRAMLALGKEIGASPVYMVNIEVPIRNGAAFVTPFGYANAINPGTFGTRRNFPPLRWAALSDISDKQGPALSRTWMMKDVDQLTPIRETKEFRVPAGLPRARVHGGHRNAIYFDLHAARTDFLEKQTP